MSAKFTPGPWHAWYRGIGWEVHPGEKCPANGPICPSVNNEFRDLFRESDAHLIAAAPDLYEACKFVKEFLDQLEDQTSDDDPLIQVRRKVHKPLRDLLEPAIAKAEHVEVPA